MTWDIVAMLILKYGMPFAERIVINATTNKPPTPEAFAELRSVLNVKAVKEASDLFAEKGILDDPKAQEILKMIADATGQPFTPSSVQ